MNEIFQTNKYDIFFSGLKEGEHKYEYKIGDTFLKNFGFNELSKVSIKINLIFIKKNTLMELHLSGKGSYVLTCDISNELFPYQVDSQLNFIIKFGEKYNDDNDQYVIIPHTSYKFNIAKTIYEMIVLSIPQKRIHPGVLDGSLNSKTLKILNKLSPGSKKTELDPRWNKLKDYL
ncbi:MAG: DUF177 domain-containing protein [Bacteroidota bacterium]|nr:DUF177 domain-containing protein [Bacteroidota bacterium]